MSMSRRKKLPEVEGTRERESITFSDIPSALAYVKQRHCIHGWDSADVLRYVERQARYRGWESILMAVQRARVADGIAKG